MGSCAQETMSWTCPRCSGAGGAGCGDPHCDTWIPCNRCRETGKITSLNGLREAVAIADITALQVMLKEQRDQGDVDWCLVQAIKKKWLEHVHLLLDAGADAQFGLNECVGAALTNPRRQTAAHFRDNASILRVLVDRGATVADAEMQCVDDVLALVTKGYSEDAKAALETFADVLASGAPKPLSLDVHRASSNSWVVNVHNVAGDQVASVDVEPSSMTLGALQSCIEEQSLIPSSKQALIHIGDKLDAHSAEATFICEILCSR